MPYLGVWYLVALDESSLCHSAVFLPVLINLHRRVFKIKQNLAFTHAMILQRRLIYGLLEISVEL